MLIWNRFLFYLTIPLIFGDWLFITFFFLVSGVSLWLEQREYYDLQVVFEINSFFFFLFLVVVGLTFDLFSTMLFPFSILFFYDRFSYWKKKTL